MRFKHILLGSVSLAAVGSGTALSHAQDTSALSPGFTYSAEGAWLMGRNTVAEDKLGNSGGPSGGQTNIQDRMGVRGALSAGIRIDDSWTFDLGGSVNQQFDARSTATGEDFGPSGGVLELTNNFSFQNLDAGAAYSPVLDSNFQLKLSGSLRGLHYTDTNDKVGTGFGGGISGGVFSEGVNTQAEFMGVGPRVGIEGSTRFGDSPIGMSGMISAAAIRGEEQTNLTASASSGGATFPITTQSNSEWKTVYDVEAALGVDVYLNDQAKFTAGYRAEQISGIADFANSGGTSGGTASRLVHGPFVKVSGSF